MILSSYTMSISSFYRHKMVTGGLPSVMLVFREEIQNNMFIILKDKTPLSFLNSYKMHMYWV